MKHLDTFENIKYADKLELKKYLILKPFINPRFEKEKLQIAKVISVEDKLSTISNNDVMISMNLLYEFKPDYTEPKKIENLSEVDSFTTIDCYFNVKKDIVYQSNDLEECLNMLPAMLDAKKYNM